MAKNKKIIKRISALCAVALVLFMAIVPALSPRANALLIHSTDETNGLTEVKYWSVPLNEFKSINYDMTIENPLFMYAYEGHAHDIYFRNDGSCSSYFGDGITWKFGTTGARGIADDEGNWTSAIVDYSIKFSSLTKSHSFTFSNSEEFIITPSAIEDFLHNMSFKIHPGYGLSAGLLISYYSANLTAEGWKLEPHSYFREFDNYVVKEDELVLKSENVYWEPIFSDFNANELAFIDDSDFSLLYVYHFAIHFEMDNPVDGFADTAETGFFSLSNGLDFTCLVSDYGTGSTFMDFYEAYPSNLINLDSATGSYGNVLTSFLKNTVGGFLSTEIIPGFTFGGVLGALLGIGIVMLLFKWFGGS